MKFEGGGPPVTGPVTISPQSQRVGAPMDVKEVPIMELDLFATGTLPDKSSDKDVTPPLASICSLSRPRFRISGWFTSPTGGP